MTRAEWTELLAGAESAEHGADLARLARRADRLAAAGGAPEGLRPARIALLGGATLDFLAGPLRLALAARGVWAELTVAGYDQALAELLDPASEAARARPDLAVVAFPRADVAPWPEPGDGAARADELARGLCARWLDAARSIHERTGAEVVLDDFAPLPTEPLGHFAAKDPASARSFLRRANVLLGDLAPPCVHVHDLRALVEDAGLERFLDLRFWHHAKQPVSFECLPLYARSLAGLAAGVLGRARKVLVTDLDDTLWGGTVGEVGALGVEAGPGTARGEAHRALQEHLLALRRRGVVLAVCTKNDRDAAEAPFREHPGMALGLDDFAAFEAGWGPKSEGLVRIARALDVGLDALVFLDDNPAERLQVRRALPQVAVPELPEDPSGYALELDRGRWFEAASIGAEDRARAAGYAARAKAAELLESTGDYDGYLRDLGMAAAVRPFRPASMARVAQLVAKTNQFNTTGLRLTRARLEELAGDPAWITRTLSLSDRFGDHGVVSALAARRADDALEIELWVMSCRVLRRRVEHLLIDLLAEAALRAGARALTAAWIATGRNGVARDLYRELGFELVSDDGDRTRWRLDLEGRSPHAPPIALLPGGSGRTGEPRR